MKKYIIAVPQHKDMEDDYQNGWEIETNLIESLELKKDDVFEVYVRYPAQTEYISLSSKEFNTLEKHGIWDSINELVSENIFIEEYEEDEILDIQNLMKIIDFLENKKKVFSYEMMLLIDKVLVLIRKAIQNNVGIYFFFYQLFTNFF